jgi:peptidyl-tRNA hydrolase, PTH1 family
VKFLIAGLGNPGDEYRHTRHNVGFEIADALAKEAGASFFPDRLADVCEYKDRGKLVTIIKPTTFMNLSGKAVRYWLNKKDISISQLLVVLDDKNIDFGKIRIRTQGSDGGHNGLKDIQAQLLTTEYPRLRFGIGSNYQKGKQVGYVLGKWTAEEEKHLPEKRKFSVEAITSFMAIGLERTMTIYNK